MQEWWGLVMIFGYFGLATLFYCFYGVNNSVGNRDGWADLLGETRVSDLEDFDYNTAILGDGEVAREGNRSKDFNSAIRVRLISAEANQLLEDD